MKVSKKTNEIEFEAGVLYPTFGVNTEVQTLDGVEKTSFLNIPCLFSLTVQKNLFIIKISLVIGLSIKLKLLEN